MATIKIDDQDLSEVTDLLENAGILYMTDGKEL